jgi:hypothetical protein
MEDLEEAMKKKNINLDSSYSNYSSHKHALFNSGFSFNATSSYSSSSDDDDRFIDYEESYHMDKYKSIFPLLINVTPNKYLLVMIYFLVL